MFPCILFERQCMLYLQHFAEILCNRRIASLSTMHFVLINSSSEYESSTPFWWRNDVHLKMNFKNPDDQVYKFGEIHWQILLILCKWQYISCHPYYHTKSQSNSVQRWYSHQTGAIWFMHINTLCLFINEINCH